MRERTHLAGTVRDPAAQFFSLWHPQDANAYTLEACAPSYSL